MPSRTPPNVPGAAILVTLALGAAAHADFATFNPFAPPGVPAPDLIILAPAPDNDSGTLADLARTSLIEEPADSTLLFEPDFGFNWMPPVQPTFSMTSTPSFPGYTGSWTNHQSMMMVPSPGGAALGLLALACFGRRRR